MPPTLFFFLKVALAIWGHLWFHARVHSKKWQCTLVFLPGKSHGWRSLVGYRPWGHKESDCLFHFCERCHWSFDKDCTESVDCFDKYGHFNNINNSSSQWTWNIFSFICVSFNFFHQCLTVFSIHVFQLHG